MKSNTILKKALYLSLALGVSPSYGATEIKSDKVMHFTISNTGLTRISIEDESIKSIFTYPAIVSDSLNLHASGNLFVAPAGLVDPIFLTVISSNGTTQDMKLTFSNKTPQPILLKVKEENIASREEIERWMTVALIGEAPRHFKRESPLKNKITTSQTVAHEFERFSNGVYSLSLWQITSKADKPVSLTPDLYIDSTEAGRLSESTLAPYGTAKLVIITKNKEKK